MANTSFLTRLSAMAVVAAAPAALFLGAGSARADSVVASARSAPGGVDVLIWAPAANPADAPSGWCAYTSTVRGNPIGKPLPAINVPFYLPEGNSARLWFPSYPTGSTWDIKVSCPNASPQFTTLVW